MTLIEFTLQGETPSKKNQRVVNRTTGKNFPSPRYRKWHYDAMVQIMQVPHRPILINEPVKISLTFTHGDERKRDSDNGTSSIMDLLKDASIIKDDMWQIVQEIHVINKFDKKNPSCKIKIEKLTI